MTKNKSNIVFPLLLASLVVMALVGVLTLLSKPPEARPSNAEDLYRSISPLVYRLMKPSGGGGTGFIAKTPKGQYIMVSNAHVCDDAKIMLASQENPYNFEYVRVLGYKKDVDLCLLSPPAGSKRGIILGDAPRPFQTTYVVGFPLLHRATPEIGHYLGEATVGVNVGAEANGMCWNGVTPLWSFWGAICIRYYVLGDTTAQIFPGNSGSPVVDFNQHLLGVINSSRQSGGGGFIPVRFLEAYLQEALK